MIYPRGIVEYVGHDEELRERFPHVGMPPAQLHVVAREAIDPDLEFERWMLEEGWRRSAEIRRYLHYLRSMIAIFGSIERSYPRANPFSSDDKDATAVQTSVTEMLVLARYLYYLDSHGVDGDVLECGCFKGFSSCCLSWACSYLGRRLIVADSFQGLPPEASQDYYRPGEFKGAFEEVQDNLRSLGRPETVDFVRGFFSDSLPGFDRRLAMIWMDVDLHSSAVDVLTHTFDSVVDGGVIFSHELFDGRDFSDERLVPTGGPAQALDEFYRARGIDYVATFCEGCLGLTVPRASGRAAFSRTRQTLLARTLALAASRTLGDQAEAGVNHALRRSLRRLKSVPVLGGVLSSVRTMARSLSGKRSGGHG
jgi:hypothetical protein